MCPDILKSLEANGFCSIGRYLDDQTLQTLTAGFELLDEATPKSTRPDLGVRGKRGVTFARRNLLSIQFVRQFIASEPVISLIDTISPGVVAVRAILFDKTGDANWTVPWHQDRSIAVATRIDVEGFGPWSKKAGIVHVQPPVSVLEGMVTLRFSLDACGLDNGPLRTIAATHRSILTATEVVTTVRDHPESICTTKAGGVVIMRPLILHASSPAKVAGHRRVLHVEFGPPTLPGELRWAMA